MTELAARGAQTRDPWPSIPLDLAVSVLAVLIAGCLKLSGVMP